MLDPSGKAIGVIGINADETERQRTEQQRALLLDELNHRVKNTLATIQSIANHTARTAPDMDTFVETILARIGAIGRAHGVLVGKPETDPTLIDLIDLIDLIGLQVGPYVTAGSDGTPGQLQLSGQSVRLDTTTGHALALVLHELTTNAAKYGAFSREGGQIHLECA